MPQKCLDAVSSRFVTLHPLPLTTPCRQNARTGDRQSYKWLFSDSVGGAITCGCSSVVRYRGFSMVRVSKVRTETSALSFRNGRVTFKCALLWNLHGEKCGPFSLFWRFNDDITSKEKIAPVVVLWQERTWCFLVTFKWANNEVAYR
jgi:hypothetical protein